MTNSDYLLKAAIKKVTEKLNEILVEKLKKQQTLLRMLQKFSKKNLIV